MLYTIYLVLRNTKLDLEYGKDLGIETHRVKLT